MREEEQRHKEGVETQHPIETHHQQGEWNNDMNAWSMFPPPEHDTHDAVNDHNVLFKYNNANHAEFEVKNLEHLTHELVTQDDKSSD
jgi:hypothetical protein